MADELNNEALELNKITVNGYEFEVTDSSARTDIDDISDAIVINNASISSRINDLNNRLETIENTDYAMADDLEEDERTTAAALNDLNDRLLAFENGTATSNYATESYVDTQISNLVNGAPAALDTLKEIADMLDNDQSVAGGIIQQLETKANSTDVYTKTAADNKFATIENLEEDEEVINAALNDLNSRVEVFEATGVQGPQGAQGEQGTQGVNGEQGTQGEVGSQGPQGVQGEVGSQGPQGEQGEVGSQGPQGEQGQGIDGYSKTVADAKFATIEELEKDEKTIAAALNELNSKLATDVYTKTQSDAKYATIEDVIDNEEVIAEAISQLSDRVDTLESGSGSGSGEGGSQGAQGIQGPQGTQGPQGETGSQGNQGTQGEQGSQGNQGTQGPQGEIGSQGNQGTQGTHGETGSQGNQGAQGVQGDSHIPSVTSSDNGKILMVVNGVWTLVSPAILYSGSGAPNNSQGNNGDLYVQTNE